MKRVRLLTSLVVSAALACLAWVLMSGGTENPIAILPSGKPYPDIPAAEFHITNQSRKTYVVTLRTEVKAKGTWVQLGGCVIHSYHLEPHSAHKEMMIMVPGEGESWRLVAEYHPPETGLSRVLNTVLRFFRLRDGPELPFQAIGPETRNDDA
jgi:hypothetical protein